MIGRSVFLDTLGNRDWAPDHSYVSEQDSMQVQMQAMFDARTEMIKLDAERILRLGMNRQIRVQSRNDFKINDVVSLRMKLGPSKEEKRRGGLRVVGVRSHHMILERGFRWLKSPQVSRPSICGRTIGNSSTD